MKDGHNDIKVVTSIAAAVLSGNGDATNGTIIDTAGYESVEVVFNVGAAGDNWAAGLYQALSFEVDDDVNGGTMAAPAAGDLLGTVVNTTDEATYQGKSYRLGYIGPKRYIRAVVTRTGNNAVGTPISATVVLGKPRHAPVA